MNNFGKMIIKSVIAEVDEKYINNRKDIGPNLNETLKNKYVKVGKDEEKYIELLRYNIIYYKSIIKKLEVIIEMWVQNGVISGPHSVEKSIANITNSSKEYVNNAMKKGQQFLNEKDKKIFSSYDSSSGLKRIEKVENDYKILNVYKDVLCMVINVISKDATRYNGILDMSIEQLKIDIMNEIFHSINDILFSEDNSEIEEYEDEALVDDHKSEVTSIDDDDKCSSFKKYLSMISTPEVSVRINDVFRDVVELENIEEEDAFVFSEDFRDYVSCVVLLMDYVSPENRNLLKNSFRLYVAGYLSQSQFEETVDKIIIDKTFIDKRSWFECQKLVKSDFNMDNNNFFGENISDEDTDMDVKSSITLIENLSDEMTVDECNNYYKFSKPRFAFNDDSDEESEGNIASKLRKGLFNFSEKLKSKNSYDEDLDDEFEDEEEYSEDYEEDSYEDEEDLDEEFEEKSSGGFGTKLKKLFSRNKDYEYDPYDTFEDDSYEEEDYDVEIDPKLFSGDSSIQDENAVAILMMREKQKIKENAKHEEKFSNLMYERKIAEEINKNGVGLFKHSDIVLTDEDFIYKKQNHNYRTRNEDLFDDIIEGQMTFDDISDNNKEELDRDYSLNDSLDSSDNSDDGIQLNPILGRTQRLNLIKLQKELEEKEARESKGENADVENSNENAENSAKESTDEPYFVELEAMKSMDPIEISNIIELSSIKKHQENENSSTINSVSDNTTVKESKSDDDLGNTLVDEFVHINKESSTEDKNLSEEELDFDEKELDYDEDDSFRESPKDKIKRFFKLSSSSEEDEEDLFDDEEDLYDDEDEEENGENKFSQAFTGFKSKLESKIETRRREKEDRFDDTPAFTKPKLIRDAIIIVAILVLIFSAYVYAIKGFVRPSVQETNNQAKQAQIEKSNNSKTGNSTNTAEKSTKEITQKTEEEKEKDEIESKASALDREAENYKAGKGTYFTVFVGATKSEEAAQTYANNFKKRGVNSVVIRNGGFYMLKVGEYFNINDAYNESARISSLNIQNYVATRNKYYDLKIEAFKTRSSKLTTEQIKTDYNDLKNQISSTGKSDQYVRNLDEIYTEALKNKQ